MKKKFALKKEMWQMTNLSPQIILLPKYNGVTGKSLPGPGEGLSVLVLPHLPPTTAQQRVVMWLLLANGMWTETCVSLLRPKTWKPRCAFCPLPILCLSEDSEALGGRRAGGAESQCEWRSPNLYMEGHLLTRNTHIGLCEEQEIYFYFFQITDWDICFHPKNWHCN